MAVTFTLTVQDPLAGMVAPVGVPNVSVVAAAAGAHVGEPPQVVLAEGTAATWMPDGSESVKVAPVSCALFVFVSVNVSVDVPLTAMGFGENALAIVGWTAALQPVNVTLSILLSEPAFVLPELYG